MLAMMHPHFMFDPIDAILVPQMMHRQAPSQRCVHETESEYQLVIQAPGTSAKDVNVSIDDGQLKMTTGKKTHIMSLPRDADADKISALCVDGLLTITIAKRAPSEPTTIAVHTTTQNGSSSSEPHYTISLASPGLAAVDLSIQVNEDGVLTVSGETERTGTRVHRSYRLPADAQGELTHATHVDGVTKMFIPKAASTKTAIPVAASDNVPAEAYDGEAADVLP